MLFKKIGVIGGGTMGQSIAEMLAAKGLDVMLVELSPNKLDYSIGMIETGLDKKLEKWAITQAEKKLILSRIHRANLSDLSACDLIIETITEDLEAKIKLFKQLEEIVSEDIILTSNTSTLSLTELASATNHPERVIGLHWIYPVSSIDVVEIIRGLKTSDDTFEFTKKFAEEVLEKKGVMVYESPGFVTSRLICLHINEALHLLEEGVASAEDIDQAVRIGYKFQHGPFEMADRFGLDSVHAALDGMFREFGELKYRPSTILKKMVRAGQLGVKTGEGFFKYDKDGDRI
ncbi:3-hydroxyacyl-CoA dehydrogenase family protein [Paenibacillus shunpengii]|uniref:3-hydroxyacyl-CoA dehydrogenase family protein n=1 Tax=Paenibacillus shunpengii TaxID=2054424 RepID=A0ABW5SQT9_9BACL|nr:MULTISPECIES: 3-hydroxyacyl-CoA dehydrogenase NAD-binding domain-containing protein [unclassified Paenibacillus]OMC68507.1 3-hydroxybutyryl-CoA dehydrogenase [Paenibacillus sp. FSL H7-0326]SDW59931.1 3-hydroxybutyryl-CoA dehydrogenase [Paenibacillus sp. PDC88]